MSRNNDRNIKKHNDKLHKSQQKVINAKVLRAEKLKQISKEFHSKKSLED